MRKLHNPMTRWLALASVVVTVSCAVEAQTPQPQERDPARAGTENGQWTYPGGHLGHTRFSPLNQLTAQHLAQLTGAWSQSDTAGIGTFQPGRGTPSYVNGKLTTVLGADRHVVSLEPITGRRLWNYVEPSTPRRAYS